MPNSKHQQFNIGVKALIIKNGRVLFLKRSDHPTWELPGGRINEKEDAAQALSRELTEELPDIKQCQVRDIVHVTQTDFTLPNGNSLMLLFFRVEAEELPMELTTSEEHQEARWVSESDITSLETKSYFKNIAHRILRS